MRYSIYLVIALICGWQFFTGNPSLTVWAIGSIIAFEAIRARLNQMDSSLEMCRTTLRKEGFKIDHEISSNWALLAFDDGARKAAAVVNDGKDKVIFDYSDVISWEIAPTNKNHTLWKFKIVIRNKNTPLIQIGPFSRQFIDHWDAKLAAILAD